MESEENTYQVISTNANEEGGNNVLSIEAECKLWVRVPIKLTVSNVEIDPITIMEIIKRSPEERMGESLSTPQNRINMTLKEDIIDIADKKVIGDFIDYSELESRDQQGSDFSEYIYGVPEITNLKIRITG